MSFKKSNLAQAWLVLLLATLFGTALAGIQAKLGPVIEANKIKETMAKIPVLVLGDDLAAELAAENQALTIKSRVIEIKQNGTTKFYTVYDAWLPDGKMVGMWSKQTARAMRIKLNCSWVLMPRAKALQGFCSGSERDTRSGCQDPGRCLAGSVQRKINGKYPFRC